MEELRDRVERFVREHGCLAGTAAVVVGLPVFLVWRLRRRRRRGGGV